MAASEKEQIIATTSTRVQMDEDDDDDEDLYPRSRVQKVFDTVYTLLSRHKAVLVFVVLMAGLTFPIAFFYTTDMEHPWANHGNCRINETFRLEVGINRISNDYPTTASCTRNFGCYNTDGNETISPTCYHSVPSTYQYYIEHITDPVNPNFMNLTIEPAWGIHTMMNRSQVYMYWETENVISLEFHPVGAAPRAVKRVPWPLREDLDIEPHPLDTVSGRLFHVAIKRKLGGAVLFDSRLAPLAFGATKAMVGTMLSSRYFHGLKGGEGNLNFGDTTIDGINGFWRNELPFYMAYHTHDNVTTAHGVLIDTPKPFIAQVVRGPTVQFEFQGDFQRSSIRFKIFLGPEPSAVLNQLKEYLTSATEQEPAKPSLTSMGIHLCRRTAASAPRPKELVERHLKMAFEEGLPYDTDCIAENLQEIPFSINSTKWADLPKAVVPWLHKPSLGAENGWQRNIVMSQKLYRYPFTKEELPDEIFIVERYRRRYFNMTKGVRTVNGAPQVTVYFSPFSSKGQDYIRENITKTWNDLKTLLAPAPGDMRMRPTPQLVGVNLVDNLPRNDVLNASIVVPQSKIELRFGSSTTWDTINPYAIHRNVPPNAYGEGQMYHLDLHNAFGEQSTKVVKEALPDALVSTVSQWTHTSAYGVYRGLQVPFTWTGLRDAVAYHLRYFMFHQNAGITICGASDLSTKRFTETEDMLCLRWFQAALLLPYVQYTLPEWVLDEKVAVNASGFKGLFQNHLKSNIWDRYALMPYYLTQVNQKAGTAEPVVTPLAYNFHQDLDNFYVQDQFMIGDSLMAAPVLERGTMRSVKFPPGTWYTFSGERISNGRPVKSLGRLVTALANYTPLFILEGHAIVVMANTTSTFTAKQALQNGRFSVLATYPEKNGTISSGRLDLRESGMTINVEITVTKNSTIIERKGLEWDVPNGDSPKLANIKLLGFPMYPRQVDLKLGLDAVAETLEVDDVQINEETNLLTVELHDKVDWKKVEWLELSWIN